MKSIVVFSLVICSSLLVACKREYVSSNTEAQPPYTDTGANVFSCYINDRLYVFKDISPNYFMHNAQIEYPGYSNNTDTSFAFSFAKVTDTNRCDFQIYARHMTDTGMHSLFDYVKSDTKSWAVFTIGRTVDTEVMYVTFKGSKLNMHVSKWDTVNKIIAGTISGDLRIYQYGPEILTIKNGQFDFKYDECR